MFIPPVVYSQEHERLHFPVSFAVQLGPCDGVLANEMQVEVTQPFPPKAGSPWPSSRSSSSLQAGTAAGSGMVGLQDGSSLGS